MDDSLRNRLANALMPVFSRVRTDICWRKTPEGPRRVNENLTIEKLKKHVNGSGHAYGAAPISPGEDTARVAVLDFDSHRGETPWAAMQAAAARVIEALENHGLSPIPFRSSGGAGIHLYLLWEAPQDAHSVRMLLKSVLLECGFGDGSAGVAAGEIEIFPKQDRVAEGKFGNMFILPLAGASVPLCPLTLGDLQKTDAIGMEWPLSRDVPLIEREVIERLPVVIDETDYAKLKSALDAIDPDQGGYDPWLKIGMAVHHETQGSVEGLSIYDEWSARGGKYPGRGHVEDKWGSFNGNTDNPVTSGTIYKLAREAGWEEDLSEYFEALPALIDEGGEEVQPLPAFRRDGKGGIIACAENLQLALTSLRVAGVNIRFDAFRASTMLATQNTEKWRNFTDEDYTRLTIHLEKRGFAKIPKEMLRDVVRLVARENEFDTAIKWINTLKHDSINRVDTFLSTYLGAPDNAYTRAVSRYMWTALPARILSPGCEAPMVPVFVGDQGVGKTRAVKALAPAHDFFAELNLAERDAEASRKMRGRLVIELGELRGLHSKDAESIKAFISRTHEEWRVLYDEFNTSFARRFLFFGTTNQEEFLADDTGERRWLPVRVGKCNIEKLERDVLQLWAEGRDRYLLTGIAWAEAENLAKGVHAEHKISDPWLPIVESWLKEKEEDGEERNFLPVCDILRGAIFLKPEQIDKSKEMRISKIMRFLGYSRSEKYVEGEKRRVWGK